MPGKTGPQKHSTSSLKAKEKESTQNAGGGKAGLADRNGGKAGHSKLICHICMAQAHDMTAMKIHHETKHPTIEWDEGKYANLHEVHGGSTQGVAVKGTNDAKKGRR
jgi:hypothetical protein